MNKKKFKYTGLSYDERLIIHLRLKDRRSIRSIANELNRSPSTISREIKHNSNRNLPSATYAYTGTKEFTYYHKKAQTISDLRRKSYHLSNRFDYFYNELKKNYDKNKSIFHNYADIVMNPKFSHLPKPCLRTIYNWIMDNPSHFDKLIIKKSRHYNYKKTTIDKNVKRRNVSERNEDFKMDYNDYNHEFGHLEADLIEGYNHKSHVLTVVDRASSLTFSRKVNSKRASDVNKEIRKIFDEINYKYNIEIKSLTTDKRNL